MVNWLSYNSKKEETEDSQVIANVCIHSLCKKTNKD